jgi:hypothetical protein
VISFPAWARDTSCSLKLGSDHQSATQQRNRSIHYQKQTQGLMPKECGRTCIAVTNSANPRYPCRLESAIAHTFARKSTNRETSVAVHQRQPETKRPGEEERGEEPSGPALTCLRSARESPDMPKKLVASAPVTRPSPSATEPTPAE